MKKEKHNMSVLAYHFYSAEFANFFYLGPVQNAYYQKKNEKISESNAHFSKDLFSLKTGDELKIA
jgi:hypothetical protein